MHVEILPSYTITVEELNAIQSMSCGTIDRLCITGSMFANMNLNGYESLGLLVNYPYGLGTTESKKRECAFAISHNIQHVDLVLSRYYLINGFYDLLLKELQAIMKYLGPKKETLSVRCMFDLSILPDDNLRHLIDVINYAGITQVALSTGTSPFELADMMIGIDIIQSHSTLQIFGGPIWNENQYEGLSKTPNISGVLFGSAKTFKKIMNK